MDHGQRIESLVDRCLQHVLTPDGGYGLELRHPGSGERLVIAAACGRDEVEAVQRRWRRVLLGLLGLLGEALREVEIT